MNTCYYLDLYLYFISIFTYLQCDKWYRIYPIRMLVLLKKVHYEFWVSQYLMDGLTNLSFLCGSFISGLKLLQFIENTGGTCPNSVSCTNPNSTSWLLRHQKFKSCQIRPLHNPIYTKSKSRNQIRGERNLKLQRDRQSILTRYNQPDMIL